jgi:hypothetical protein
MECYYIFENLSMSKGALACVDNLWSCNIAKVIDY